MYRFLNLICCFIYLNACAQTKSKGLVLNDAAYDILPMKASLTRSIYDAIPAQASLKAYCPTAGNQTPYSTCVGWATSYGARTILWAKQQGITEITTITEHAFSPDFIYRSIVPETKDNRCEAGTRLDLALNFMKENGDVLKKDFYAACPSIVPNHLLDVADDFKIQDFARLFGLSDEADTKINTTKKSLAEGNPVTIGMLVTSSFNALDGELWSPTEDLKQHEGGHALCLIGYDDNKYGGAFEILNSWGTQWGNKGFFWVTYKDFAYWTVYGFELINNIKPAKPEPHPSVVVNPTPTPEPLPEPKPAPPTEPHPSVIVNPTPTPEPKPTTEPTPLVVIPTPVPTPNIPKIGYDFSGNLRFSLSNNSEMTAHIQEVRGLYVDDAEKQDESPTPKVNPSNFEADTNFETGKFIAYRMDKAYTEGTRFRLFLRNNEPAYVYAIALDNTNQAVVLFPHKSTISPALNYKNNEVALPSEDKYIVMDNIKGTDIFCLLYAKEPLDIKSICQNLEKETGTFFQRLHKTMQDKLVDRQYLRYYKDEIRFEVQSYGSGTVVPIVVEIPHN